MRADLKYIASRTSALATGETAYNPGDDTGLREADFNTHTVDIANARGMDLSLDRQGFTLAKYDGELANIVKRATGAKRVEVFDSTKRIAQPTQGIASPSTVIHNDYTATSGPRRLRYFFPELQPKRFAIINIWRPIVNPVYNNAMTFCDAKTMNKEDLIDVKVKQAGDRTGNIYFLNYNPNQKWYYFDEMQTNEVALSKVYDSNESVSRFTAHTSFVSADVPSSVPARQSIETRCFVFY